MYRKLFSLCLFALLLVLLTFLFGCGDDSTSPSQSGFSFKLKVVDQSGAPISGLKLSRRCRIEYAELPGGKNQVLMQPSAGSDAGIAASFQSGIGQVIITKSEPGTDPLAEFFLHPAAPNPGTSMNNIKLDVGGACDLGITILNWKDEELSNFATPLSEGTISLTLIYPFIDEGHNDLPNGIFHAVFTVTEPDTSTVLFEDSVCFSGYTDRDPFRQLIGHTDADGLFSTADKGYFPSLQGNQPQMGCDFQGEEQGLFSFSNTIEIKVMSELPPLTGGVVYWMARELVISDDSNGFEWTFVPDDSLLVLP